ADTFAAERNVVNRQAHVLADLKWHKNSLKSAKPVESFFLLFTFGFQPLTGLARKRSSFNPRPAAAAVLQPQPPDHPERLIDDVARQFGTAFDALGKGDGHLDDPETRAPEAVGHFDLEAVTVGL